MGGCELLAVWSARMEQQEPLLACVGMRRTYRIG